MKISRPATTGDITYWALFIVALLAIGTPAQSQEYSLFDRFSVGVGASSLGMDTKIRLDAKNLDLGAEIDFESDLGLSSSEVSAALDLAWNFRKRHLLFLRYDAAERDSMTRVATELRFGDLVIPIEGDVIVSFDVEETLVGYSYYPWRRDRWAFGLGLGVRVLDFAGAVQLTDVPQAQRPIVVSERADATGPLPFLNFDHRYGIAPKWRLVANFGWLDLKLGEFDGSQTVLGARIEHLAHEHFLWGFAASISAVDVDGDTTDFTGNIKFDITRLSLFVKGRW